MRKILGGLCLIVTALAARAETSFVRQLTAEERAAAGIEQLSPAQVAALDQAVARFAREGARVEVARVREEAKAEVEQVVRKREEAKAGLTRDGDAAVKSKLTGTFRGWSGQTLFPLENGQTWVQTDKSDRYWLPPEPGPDVEIRPSGIGGWKLFLPNGRWVRVRRVN